MSKTNVGTEDMSQATPGSNGAAKELSIILYNYKREWNYAIEMRNPEGAQEAHDKALTQLQHLIEQREAESYDAGHKDGMSEMFKRLTKHGVVHPETKTIEIPQENIALSTDTDGLASDKPTVRKDTNIRRGKS